MSAMMWLPQLLDKYSEVKGLAPKTQWKYKAAINRFNQWIGHEGRLMDLANHVNEFLLEYAATGVHPFTLQDKAACFKALLDYAAKKRWCEHTDVRRIIVPETAPHALTTNQVRRFLKWCSPIQKAAVMLCYDTGLRRGDIFNATWDQLSKKPVNGGVTYCYRLTWTVAKTGRFINRRVRRKTVELLESIRKADNPHLIPWTKSFVSWNKAWKRAAENANVPTTGIQDIRRTGATQVARAGGSATEYLDHRNPNVARLFYIDPRIAIKAGPMPPPVKGIDDVLDDEPEYGMAMRAGLDG